MAPVAGFRMYGVAGDLRADAELVNAELVDAELVDDATLYGVDQLRHTASVIHLLVMAAAVATFAVRRAC